MIPGNICRQRRTDAVGVLRDSAAVDLPAVGFKGDCIRLRFPLCGELDAAGGLVLGNQRLEVLTCRVIIAFLVFPAGEAKSGFRQAAPVRDFWISCGIGGIEDKSIREVTFRAARVIADLVTEDDRLFRGIQEFGIALITAENRQIIFRGSLTSAAPCRDAGAAFQRDADEASCCRCFIYANAGTFMQINAAAAFCGAPADDDRISIGNKDK